jgi:hypothetical protein
MNPFNEAIVTASRGLDWSRPCLIWVADYLLAETGRDPAADWRREAWREIEAKRALISLASEGHGNSSVSQALDVIARREGWEPATETRQGAIMVGVFDGGAIDGVPAIFDGLRGWLVGRMQPGCMVVQALPDRIWEVPRAA